MEIDDSLRIVGLVLATAAATGVVAATLQAGTRTRRRRAFTRFGRMLDMREKATKAELPYVRDGIDGELIEMARDLDPRVNLRLEIQRGEFESAEEAYKHQPNPSMVLEWGHDPERPRKMFPQRRSKWRQTLYTLRWWARRAPLIVTVAALAAVLITQSFSPGWATALAGAGGFACAAGTLVNDLRTDRRKEPPARALAREAWRSSRPTFTASSYSNSSRAAPPPPRKALRPPPNTGLPPKTLKRARPSPPPTGPSEG